MSALKAKIQKSVTDAMKAKDSARLTTLRLIWNAVRKKEIDERKDLGDAEVEKAILTMIKQTTESLDQARAASRAEAVAEAEAELKVMKEFLPEAMSEADVTKVVEGVYAQLKPTLPTGGAAMGMVMKASMAEIGSRAEGRVIQATVKKVMGL